MNIVNKIVWWYREGFKTKEVINEAKKLLKEVIQK